MEYYQDEHGKVHAFANKSTALRYIKKLNLKKISLEEKLGILFKPPTMESRSIEINELVNYIVNSEAKNRRRFHGWGFVDGMSTVAIYAASNEEAMKLAVWAEAVWAQISLWRDTVIHGEEKIIKYTDDFIIANVPKIEDF